MSVNFKQLPDGSLGLEGVDAGNGPFMKINIPYNTNSPLTLSACILPRKCVIQSITAVPDVASSNAVTASVYQAPSGTALGSGAVVHSGSINLQGTAANNQALTLAAAAVAVAAGSRLGLVISGALGAAGSGVVTIAMTPA